MVALLDIDGQIPNLALMKIAAHLKSRGIIPVWYDSNKRYDIVFASKIFKEGDIPQISGDKVFIGGSGYDLKSVLPENIDNLFPDYSMYPDCNYSMGYVTRGCIRKCHFCIVPEKEGKIHKYKDVSEIWRGFDNLVLLDNNILAMKEEFFKVIDFCLSKNIAVDFNQGLDCRLLDDEIIKILNSTNVIKPYVRMAFDDLNYRDKVEFACRQLKKRSFWYVYCDENFESALERVLILKRHDQHVYLMRDAKVRGRDKKLRKFNVLAHWCNCLGARRSWDFFDHIHYYHDKDYFKKLSEN